SSLAAIVHSQMAERALTREVKLPVVRLPLPFPSRGVPAPHAGPPPWRLVVFGFLGANRCLEDIVTALGYVADRRLFRLHIYGEMSDPSVLPRLTARTKELRMEHAVAVHGFVPEAELERALDDA